MSALSKEIIEGSLDYNNEQSYFHIALFIGLFGAKVTPETKLNIHQLEP